MWIDDWDYKYGEWKHVLHRGDEDKQSVQPGVWLHPTLNKLVVKFDRKDRKPDYEYKDRHVYNSFKNFEKLPKRIYISKMVDGMTKNMPERQAMSDDLVHVDNITNNDIKKWCTSQKDCQGFTVIDMNEGDISDPENKVLVGLIPSEKNDHLISNDDDKNNIFSYGTFIRNKDNNSMDPSVNKNIISDSTIKNEVDNISIGRWIHLCIVVSNNTTQVYIDGKLRSSTVLESEISRNHGDLWLTQNGGFSGITTRLQYFNSAIDNKEIHNLYLQGPNKWIIPDYTKYFKKSYWLKKKKE